MSRSFESAAQEPQPQQLDNAWYADRERKTLGLLEVSNYLNESLPPGVTITLKHIASFFSPNYK